jgi:alpha-ketoglutarate-dependent taurine dioxygenase
MNKKFKFYKEKKRPKNNSLAEINMNHVNDLLNSDYLLERFVNYFNKYGFVLITPNELGDNLVSLKSLFGTLVKHEKMNSNGILVIDPLLGHSIGQKNAQLDHLPHTDESFLSESSKIMILQCVTQSCTGGDTTIVYGSEMYNYCKKNFTKEEVQLLFLKDCISVSRTLSNSSKTNSSSFPIFSYNEKNCLEIKWRSMDSYVNKVNEKVFKLYEKLNKFVCDSRNQFKFKLKENQILVVDNRALCHGRTSFSTDEKRTLWRTNYMNDGKLNTVLLNGFNEVESEEWYF